MKKVLLFMMAMIIATGAVSAQEKGVKWQQGTLQQAITKAASEKKLVFVDCFAVWCGPCKQMSNVEFKKEAAGKYFNSKFVSIAIDMEKGEGPAIAKKYGVNAYPTFLILNGTGKVLGTVVGGDDIDSFIKKVNAVVTKK
ncbi:MAG: thioredoxin family protein [Rikenellaceae bacterium]